MISPVLATCGPICPQHIRGHPREPVRQRNAFEIGIAARVVRGKCRRENDDNDDMVKEHNFTAPLSAEALGRGIDRGSFSDTRVGSKKPRLRGEGMNPVGSNSPNDGNFNDGPIRIK